MTYKPVVLIVLDGVGVNTAFLESEYAERIVTPFSTATMPTWRALEQFWPFTTLRASGVAVGLPWGEEGNSEVGHLTMGTGRIPYHHLPRIVNAIYDHSFFTNEELLKAARHVKEHHSTFHVMGLFSSGSVHAYVDHLYALLDFAKEEGLERVMLHLFTDGRDSPPEEARTFFPQLEKRLEKQYPGVLVASLIGRHYAMDRDDHWDRVEKAYAALVGKGGATFQSPLSYIQDSYAKGLMDEFLLPAYRVNEKGEAIGRVGSGDALVFFNFREDSARELSFAFAYDEFSRFPRTDLADLFFVTMTAYDKRLQAAVLFEPLELSWPIARVIAYAKRRQLHVAETEKYAHVSYFFNGGLEKPFEGEDRILIPSPRAAHFDEMPEMGAEGITDAVLVGIPTYDFILANYANGDMVGHTGNFEATVRALEVLDAAIGKIIPEALEEGGAVIVTADHGNVEEKRYQATGKPRTKHTANPVPFFLVARGLRRTSPRLPDEIQKKYAAVGGVLTDVAPTVLELMHLERPGEMTGMSLLGTITSRSFAE